MENTHKKSKTYGLLGKNIDYSFSRGYFKSKFEKESLPHQYVNLDWETLDNFKDKIFKIPNIDGFNVTIPYKEEIIPYLNSIDEAATKIGAVNCVKISPNNKITGYNTDYLGFSESIRPLLKKQHQKALILGDGGASKAVVYALENMGINCTIVSRKGFFTYHKITLQTLENHKIIVNCTPLGTTPSTDEMPEIPLSGITNQHLIYDLIYNPSKTKLLIEAEHRGAVIKNGLEMLQIQAEKSWEIWEM
jgi:shikimate dehydrogenase